MLNIITIMGRLTAAPELRYTQNETAVTSFTVAVERDFGDKATDFIPCVAWRQTGEFVSKFFRKGSMIAVTGRLQSRSFENKDGESRRVWEIVVDHAYFTGERRTEDGPGNFVEVSEPRFVELDGYGDGDGELTF